MSGRLIVIMMMLCITTTTTLATGMHSSIGDDLALNVMDGFLDVALLVLYFFEFQLQFISFLSSPLSLFSGFSYINLSHFVLLLIVYYEFILSPNDFPVLF